MTLRDLDGIFLKYAPYFDTWVELQDGIETSVSGMRKSFKHVYSLADADGVRFLCPRCFADNKGPVGTHSVICWFTDKVPSDLDPGPGRWNPSGTGLEDLTFIGPGATSVALHDGCRWHGFVSKGEAA